MSLLPLNQSKQNQAFASLIDEKTYISYDGLKIDPLTCDVSFLEHIAIKKGADISNLSEKEARVYLSTFDKRFNGTVKAVKDAIDVFFQDSSLVEWFDDENLKKGTFRVDMFIQPQREKYDKKTFDLLNRLINNSKNVRSKLAGYKIKFPPAVAVVEVGVYPDILKVHPYMDINELISSNIQTQAGYFYDVKAKTDVNELIGVEDINLQGGYRWQVEA